MRKLGALGLWVACAIGLAQDAAAAPIRFEFTATVEQVFATGTGLGVTVGMTVTGSITFDPADPRVGGPYPTISVQIPAAGYALTPPDTTSSFQIVDRSPGGGSDVYIVRSRPSGIGTIEFRLSDASGTALSSTAIPLTPPDVASFSAYPTSFLNVFAGGIAPTQILRGRITSLTLAVPEPSLAALGGLGALLLLGARAHSARCRN